MQGYEINNLFAEFFFERKNKLFFDI
jgi:hypothetical protein